MSKYKSKIKVNYPTLATTARMGHPAARRVDQFLQKTDGGRPLRISRWAAFQDDDGFGNAIMHALAVGMDEELDEPEAAFEK